MTSVQQEDMMDTIATTTSTFGLNQFTKQEILTAQDECKHTSEIKALLTGEKVENAKTRWAASRYAPDEDGPV